MIVLRWIGVLPAAILGYLLIQVVVIVGFVFLGLDTLTYLPTWLVDLIGLAMNMLLAPFAFVYAGAWMAPSRRLFVAVSLSAFFIALMCGSTSLTYLLGLDAVGPLEKIAGNVTAWVSVAAACFLVHAGVQEEA